MKYTRSEVRLVRGKVETLLLWAVALALAILAIRGAVMLLSSRM